MATSHSLRPRERELLSDALVHYSTHLLLDKKDDDKYEEMMKVAVILENADVVMALRKGK